MAIAIAKINFKNQISKKKKILSSKGKSYQEFYKFLLLFTSTFLFT